MGRARPGSRTPPQPSADGRVRDPGERVSWRPDGPFVSLTSCCERPDGWLAGPLRSVVRRERAAAGAAGSKPSARLARRCQRSVAQQQQDLRPHS